MGTVTFGVFNGATQIGSTVVSGTVAAGAASASYAARGNGSGRLLDPRDLLWRGDVRGEQ